MKRILYHYRLSYISVRKLLQSIVCWVPDHMDIKGYSDIDSTESLASRGTLIRPKLYIRHPRNKALLNSAL